jgi:hypothetical protein
MTADGKSLEALVAFVEQQLLPPGSEVRTNRVEYDENGKPIAEFDVEIVGRFGSSDVTCLFECRDRPSEGPAPAAWIEQMVGRRTRFGFSKVTAVSTTGFATGARNFAQKADIELRVVQRTNGGGLDWVRMDHITGIEHTHKLTHANIFFDVATSADARRAGEERLMSLAGPEPFLKKITTGEMVTANDAFIGAVREACPDVWTQLKANGAAIPIRLEAHYPDATDHFVLETDQGDVWVSIIQFIGELSLVERKTPIETLTYTKVKDGAVISEVAKSTMNLMGKDFSLEIHRVSDAPHMQIILRPPSKSGGV